jgi:putative two-component system response regulator
MACATILIADASENFLSFCRDALEDKYDILTSKEGNEAWEVIQSRKPDLVVLNVDLPGLDGLQIARQIEESKILSNTAVVLVSNMILDHDLPDGFWRMSTDADGFLTKPIDPARLRDQIQSVFLKRGSRGPFKQTGYL